MGWEKRGNNLYYYRKERIGNRVVSRYVGRGELAEIANELIVLDHFEKVERRKTRQDQVQLTNLMKEAWDKTQKIYEDAMIQAGYHKHKGQWRKRRRATS